MAISGEGNSHMFSLEIEVPKACQECSSVTGTKICARCKTVYYCGKQCQQAGWEEHKGSCKRIAHWAEKVELEASELKEESHGACGALSHDSGFGQTAPVNHFVESVGKFWTLFETRNYCRAKATHCWHLQQLGSPSALKKAVEGELTLLRLDLGDSLLLRNIVIFGMLELGMNQECYDFIKWWGCYGKSLDSKTFRNGKGQSLGASLVQARKRAGVSGDDTCEPVASVMREQSEYLSIQGADTAEPIPREFSDASGCLSLQMCVALIVIKFRLISEPNSLVLDPNSTNVSEVERQLFKLMSLAKAMNGGFWKAVQDPELLLSMAAPQAMSIGSWEHARLCLDVCLRLCRNEPGFMDFLRRTTERLRVEDWLDPPTVHGWAEATRQGGPRDGEFQHSFLFLTMPLC